MLSFPTQTRYWIVPLIVSAISLIGFLCEPVSGSLFAFEREAIMDLEIWRLISGHFLHTNLAHLVLNLAGLGLLWALHGEYYTPKTLTVLLLALTLVSSLFMFFLSPQLEWYVGLSGVLHGVFTWGAIKDIARGEKTGILLLLGIAVKLAYEQLVGGTDNIASLIQANVAIDAHLFGAMTGTILAIGELYTRRFISSSKGPS